MDLTKCYFSRNVVKDHLVTFTLKTKIFLRFKCKEAEEYNRISIKEEKLPQVFEIVSSLNGDHSDFKSLFFVCLDAFMAFGVLATHYQRSENLE